MRDIVPALICLTIVIIFWVGSTHAKLTPSNSASPQFKNDVDLDNIQKILESKLIRDRMEEIGFTKEEVQRRLKEMDRGQIHQLAVRLENIDSKTDNALSMIATLLIAIFSWIIFYFYGHKFKRNFKKNS